MCGIVGVWERGGTQPPADVIERMLATILHRGPDGGGSWIDGDLALGHRRLTILDLTAAAHQPMHTADGQGTIVYNGEVYNVVQLRTELETEGAVFTSTGDTQVVLEALHRWGPARAIERFDGMFAFAYFDRRSETLWLARDRLGIKPLHVALDGERVVFGSEIKALLAHPGIEARPHLAVIATFLVEGSIGGPQTPFEGIEDLEPGSLWRITRAGIERARWFDILDRIDVERIRVSGSIRPADVVDAFDRALRESVARHLVSDVPVATMCSGGVDSSLLTALARERVPDLVAYVADLDGETEGAIADRVGRHLGVPIVRVAVDRETMLRMLPEVVWQRDLPSFHASDAPHIAVARRCRADGIKVLLTGEGSDELFGGYPWQRRVFETWRRLRRQAPFLGRRRLRRRMQRLHFTPGMPITARKDPDLRLRIAASLEPSRQLRPVHLYDRLEGVEPIEDRAFLAQCFNDLHVHLRNILFRHDRSGMAASMEMRVPFLDNALIDMGMHLARGWKLRRGVSKWTVKQVALRHLPKDVVHARKKGFPIPPGVTRGSTALLRNGAVAQLMRWSKEDQDLLIPRIEADPTQRHQVATLEIWARLFLAGERPENVTEQLLASAK